MALLRSGRTAGGLVTVAALAAGLAAALGAGYTVAEAALSDGSAYVTKGTSVAHVNGESRTIDGTTTQAVGANGDPIEVRQLPTGQVIAINGRTGKPVTVDPGTLKTRPTAGRGVAIGGKGAVATVVSGNGGWLVDFGNRKVSPLRGGTATTSYAVPGDITDAAPGPDGSVVVLLRDGTLRRIGTDGGQRTVDANGTRGGALTVAGGTTYLVTREGAVLDVSGASARSVAGVGRSVLDPTLGGVLVGSLQGSGQNVLIVVGDDLIVVDPATGKVGSRIQLRADGHELGRPVEYRGRVYVPDYDAHKIIVVDLARTQRLPDLQDVPGDQQRFDLFVEGGRLWANDQYSRLLVQFDGTTRHTVDKGPGGGVRGDRPQRTGTGSTVPPTGGTTLPPTRGSLPPTGGSLPPTGGSLPPTGGTLPPTGGTAPQGGGGDRPTGGSTRAPGGGGNDPSRATQVVVPTPAAGTFLDEFCATLRDADLRCNPIAKDDPKVESDTVTDVPQAGRKVPAGSAVDVYYAGKPAVPTPRQDDTVRSYCDTVTKTGFTCRFEAAPGPAATPDAFGRVSETQPTAGTDLATGEPVTIVYYATFALPNLVGQNASTVCTQLTRTAELPVRGGAYSQATMRCTVDDGDPAPKGNPGAKGTVQSQTPDAGGPVAGGDTVTVRQYTGDAIVPEYRGQNADVANAACNQQPFTCQIVDGQIATANGQPAANLIGQVYEMQNADNASIAGDSRQPVGATIKLVRYVGQGAVPDVSNRPPDQACAELAAAGFNCTKNGGQQTASYNNVVGQSPAAGTSATVGTVVTVNYNGIPLVGLNLYQRNENGGYVQIARVADRPAPDGFTLVGTLGRVYYPNSGTGNGNWELHEFTANCGGHTPNILYSHGAPGGCMSGGGGASAAGMIVPSAVSGGGYTCDVPGSVWLYRVTTDTLGPNGTTVRNYSVSGPVNGAPPAGWQEQLGCMYSP
ncbi:PASTA domain-containing protein [Jatrophihabitans fulvus]